MTRKGVAILGSTGSIGTSALRVLARQSDRFFVTALTANTNASLLAEQEREFSPSYVGLVKGNGDKEAGWGGGTDVLVEAATRD
ncbi:MAG TPA: 1-deoxy-D-xylulose-5-phosphate reductoisomerase, partial [Gemmatimonadaceae bacterium]|nr:1-deoxy-D-xylulose-5-phosphate reductoisomerase [Gemmatimonadaceae bacterium]